MNQEPKVIKTAWTVWAVFLACYLATNAVAVFGNSIDREKAMIGFGVVMPILSNLVWWLIAFRLRFRMGNWWLIGIVNALIVGLAGFGTMLLIVSRINKENLETNEIAALEIPTKNAGKSARITKLGPDRTE